MLPTASQTHAQNLEKMSSLVLSLSELMVLPSVSMHEKQRLLISQAAQLLKLKLQIEYANFARLIPHVLNETQQELNYLTSIDQTLLLDNIENVRMCLKCAFYLNEINIIFMAVSLNIRLTYDAFFTDLLHKIAHVPGYELLAQQIHILIQAPAPTVFPLASVAAVAPALASENQTEPVRVVSAPSDQSVMPDQPDAVVTTPIEFTPPYRSVSTRPDAAIHHDVPPRAATAPVGMLDLEIEDIAALAAQVAALKLPNKANDLLTSTIVEGFPVEQISANSSAVSTPTTDLAHLSEDGDTTSASSSTSTPAVSPRLDEMQRIDTTSPVIEAEPNILVAMPIYKTAKEAIDSNIVAAVNLYITNNPKEKHLVCEGITRRFKKRPDNIDVNFLKELDVDLSFCLRWLENLQTEPRLEVIVDKICESADRNIYRATRSKDLSAILEKKLKLSPEGRSRLQQKLLARVEAAREWHLSSQQRLIVAMQQQTIPDEVQKQDLDLFTEAKNQLQQTAVMLAMPVKEISSEHLVAMVKASGAAILDVDSNGRTLWHYWAQHRCSDIGLMEHLKAQTVKAGANEEEIFAKRDNHANNLIHSLLQHNEARNVVKVLRKFLTGKPAMVARKLRLFFELNAQYQTPLEMLSAKPDHWKNVYDLIFEKLVECAKHDQLLDADAHTKDENTKGRELRARIHSQLVKVSLRFLDGAIDREIRSILNPYGISTLISKTFAWQKLIAFCKPNAKISMNPYDIMELSGFVASAKADMEARYSSISSKDLITTTVLKTPGVDVAKMLEFLCDVCGLEINTLMCCYAAQIAEPAPFPGLCFMLSKLDLTNLSKSTFSAQLYLMVLLGDPSIEKIDLLIDKGFDLTANINDGSNLLHMLLTVIAEEGEDLSDEIYDTLEYLFEQTKALPILTTKSNDAGDTYLDLLNLLYGVAYRTGNKQVKDALTEFSLFIKEQSYKQMRCGDLRFMLHRLRAVCGC